MPSDLFYNVRKALVLKKTSKPFQRDRKSATIERRDKETESEYDIRKEKIFGGSIVQTVLLVIALSIDVFLACMACGTEKIRIKKEAAGTISGICSGVLLLSLLAGGCLGEIVRERDRTFLCFLGFLLIGLYKLSEYTIKVYIRKNKFLCKCVKITFSQLNFILSIYNDPVVADKDRSSVMSVSEAVFFALAMSLDGLFGGISAGFLERNILLTVGLNFAVGFLAVKAGSGLGMRLAARKEWDLSWLGGVLFLVLAFAKLC